MVLPARPVGQSRGILLSAPSPLPTLLQSAGCARSTSVRMCGLEPEVPEEIVLLRRIIDFVLTQFSWSFMLVILAAGIWCIAPWPGERGPYMSELPGTQLGWT